MIRLDANHPILHRVVGTQRGKGFQMLVNGTGTQVAAARHGNLCGTKPAQKRTKKIIAGAHLTGKLVGDLGAVDMGGIDFVCAFADHANVGTQFAENLQRGHDITDTGKIFNNASATCQNRGRQNGNCRIFGSANGDLARQRCSAANDKLFQSNASLLCDSRTRPATGRQVQRSAAFQHRPKAAPIQSRMVCCIIHQNRSFEKCCL